MNSDDPVEELLARCLEQSEEDWQGALHAACDEHPEHAAELRARFEVLQGLGMAAPPGAAGDFPERLGDFRLLRRLGAGGMGVVYVAEQESLRRRVALKLIRPGHLYFPESRTRFRREVEAVARLQHRGIVPVHLVGEERGIPFFAMEWVQGATFADLLEEVRSRRPQDLTGADLAAALVRAATRICGEPVHADPNAEVFRGSWAECCLRIVRQVAAALQHAHERGVLHRDVKPSNILLTPDGRALLVDFGLASSEGSGSLTRQGSWVGSLPYMPPERFLGVSDDPRSDVYSLGVTLYEALTLRLPFQARNAEEVKRRILAETPVRVRSRNPAVAWDVETVCHVALEKPPARRYASAADLEADLTSLLEHRPIAARRPGPLLRARRWVQRHPARSVALLAAILLVWGLPILWWTIERSNRSVLEQRLAEIRRLKDHKLLRELLESEAELHPASPALAGALGAWLDQAREVEGHRARHRTTLERLQQELAASSAADPGALAWEIDMLEGVLALLDQVAAVRPSVEFRHEFARFVAGRTVEGEEAAALWEEAAFEIEESRLYDGLVLAPQMGLLPLEPDPGSGLWEFWHVLSGDRPERDPATGRWRITGDTGIVLVLLPGGTFPMGCELPSPHRPPGSPNVDPRCSATGIESPPHPVTLDPFFLSRYEMTQGQWLRFTRSNPSANPPERDTGFGVVTLAHPVEAMTWLAADRVARQLGLQLPTESQWEYACRAGTTTVFSFGDDPADMARHGNVLDRRWSQYGHARADDLEDPFWQHAPVGSFEPNAFGLHDVHGNLYEWCADQWANYVVREAQAGDGLRVNPPGNRQRVVRGGAWKDSTLWARSAARHFLYEDATDSGVGLRPARALDPPAPARNP